MWSLIGAHTELFLHSWRAEGQIFTSARKQVLHGSLLKLSLYMETFTVETQNTNLSEQWTLTYIWIQNQYAILFQGCFFCIMQCYAEDATLYSFSFIIESNLCLTLTFDKWTNVCTNGQAMDVSRVLEYCRVLYRSTRGCVLFKVLLRQETSSTKSSLSDRWKV